MFHRLTICGLMHEQALSASVAVVEGAALEDGLELVLSCDLRVCGVPLGRLWIQ